MVSKPNTNFIAFCLAFFALGLAVGFIFDMISLTMENNRELEKQEALDKCDKNYAWCIKYSTNYPTLEGMNECADECEENRKRCVYCAGVCFQ